MYNICYVSSFTPHPCNGILDHSPEKNTVLMKLKYEHIFRRNSVSKELLQRTVDWKRRQGRHNNIWLDSTTDWTQICVDDFLESGPNDEEWWLNNMFVRRKDRLTVSIKTLLTMLID